MSVLKSLKSIFIVEEKEESTSSNHSKEKPIKKARQHEISGKSDSGSSASSIPGEQDEKIINTLFQALEKSNLDGFDYIEFKKSVKGLEKMVLDEATRYKSAFSTASTMGVTLDKLVQTADYYIKVLDKERHHFVRAAGEQTTALVENRKHEIQLLLKSMAEKKELVQKLTKELTTSENKLKSIQEGIDRASVKIEKTKKNFDVSFNHLRGQIATDINKMKNYLK